MQVYKNTYYVVVSATLYRARVYVQWCYSYTILLVAKKKKHLARVLQKHAWPGVGVQCPSYPCLHMDEGSEVQAACP
jgi:hypothetical protein